MRDSVIRRECTLRTDSQLGLWAIHLVGLDVPVSELVQDDVSPFCWQKVEKCVESLWFRVVDDDVRGYDVVEELSVDFF